MYEPLPEPPEVPSLSGSPSRTVLVSRSPGAEPVAARLRAAGWTVIWTAPASAWRRTGGDPPRRPS